MKRKRMNDDYWPPRPGSWEEAVDPYDVQWSRVTMQTPNRSPREVPARMLSEPAQQINVPAAL